MNSKFNISNRCKWKIHTKAFVFCLVKYSDCSWFACLLRVIQIYLSKQHSKLKGTRNSNSTTFIPEGVLFVLVKTI